MESLHLETNTLIEGEDGEPGYTALTLAACVPFTPYLRALDVIQPQMDVSVVRASDCQIFQ